MQSAQSTLILAKEKSKASAHISNFLKEEGIDPIDINLQTFEKAMGIPDVRNIQKSISLKPFRGKTKAVVIQAYEDITTEAQNALLKVLEEPPANTLIIISISRKELLLPTILSRCKITELTEEELAIDDEDIARFNDALNVIFNGRIGDKLKAAQNIAADKEEAMWISKMSVFVKEKVIENYTDPKYLNLLRQLQKTYSVIKSTNANKRVALENLFLSF